MNVTSMSRAPTSAVCCGSAYIAIRIVPVPNNGPPICIASYLCKFTWLKALARLSSLQTT